MVDADAIDIIDKLREALERIVALAQSEKSDAQVANETHKIAFKALEESRKREQ